MHGRLNLAQSAGPTLADGRWSVPVVSDCNVGVVRLGGLERPGALLANLPQEDLGCAQRATLQHAGAFLGPQVGRADSD